jgi:putative membrane protein
MTISKQDSARVAAAIRSAERNTSAEIVCILASSSSHLTALPVLLAAIASLAAPWVLMLLTNLPVQRLLSTQIAIFCVLVGLFGWPTVRTRLLPRKARRSIAHQAAMNQFIKRGLAEPKSGPAILIFISLAERYARIIANEQVASRVPDQEWRRAIDELIGHVRSGRIADGFIAAIAKSGGVLKEHFPAAAGSPERFSDRLHLI